MAKPKYMLEWTLKTHCAGCGVSLGCSAQIVQPEAEYAELQKRSVVHKLQQMEGKCPNCDKQQDPLPLKWVETIGALF